MEQTTDPLLMHVAVITALIIAFFFLIGFKYAQRQKKQ